MQEADILYNTATVVTRAILRHLTNCCVIRFLSSLLLSSSLLLR